MQIVKKFQFIIIILIFYFTNQVELYALFILFVIIHEMGHLTMGILLGKKIDKIKLLPLGISISFKIIVEDYNKKIINGSFNNIKNMLIAIAGPFVNFAIAFILYSLNKNNISTNIEIMIYINLLICVFNLLPIYPLDGGRIVKEILCILLGKREAIEKVNIASNISLIILTILSSILIYIIKNISVFLIIVYLWVLVIQENKKYSALKNIYILADKFKNE